MYWLKRILGLLAPRTCAVCGNRLSPDETMICAKCNLHLPRTSYADNPYDNEMARLFWARIPVERCVALFRFESGSQAANIIYRLKYKSHPEIGEYLGLLIAKEFSPKSFFEEIDYLIPIPLARKRQRQRGYNQSEEIAKGIHQATGIPLATKVVRRKDFKGSQTRLNKWERLDNVEGAFELLDGDHITGKHILLIDDVVTTGATITSCGQEIARAGNVKISVLSIGFAKN